MLVLLFGPIIVGLVIIAVIASLSVFQKRDWFKESNNVSNTES